MLSSHTYAYVYTYVYTYKHTYIQTYMHTYIQVQAQAWPVAMCGHDLIAVAETGSGKALYDDVTIRMMM